MELHRFLWPKLVQYGDTVGQPVAAFAVRRPQEEI